MNLRAMTSAVPRQTIDGYKRQDASMADTRAEYRTKSQGGAPRPMKMGTYMRLRQSRGFLRELAFLLPKSPVSAFMA